MVEASLNAASLLRVRTGALLHRMPAAIFSIAGPGALQCLQGLLTNDLMKAADGSAVYGALLTPKGLIILDCWVIKLGDRFLFLADLDARAVAADLFRKQLPPRLAKVTDLSDEWQAHRLFGGGATPLTPSAPPPVAVATPAAGGPFAALIVGPADAVADVVSPLAAAGALNASDDEWEGSRILAGWPRRGAEIDEKTLVQEVRFDENHGVSYEKGCYTGQETVARLHFRGHTNRDLRGLVMPGEARDPLASSRIVLAEKEVGSVRSLLTLPTQSLALALIRREVATGQVVMAGDTPATVVDLPFAN